MKTIKVFLGGGVQLLHGDETFKGYRNDVIDPVVGQLNAIDAANHCFIAKDYSDLTRNVVKGKQQHIYNKFIVNDADAALFIINGNIGNLTRHEIDCAVQSTKKKKHPVVFIYGINIKDDDEILEYLDQEGIYYQHFFDNRDLIGKIKADLQFVASHLERIKRKKRIMVSTVLALIALVSFFVYPLLTPAPPINESCNAQLYLMRYKDINSLAGHEVFSPDDLSQFKYEDSIISGNSIRIFPLISSDTVIHVSNPFLRIKLYNKSRNTIVLVSAELEIDQFETNMISHLDKFMPLETGVPDVQVIDLTPGNQTYKLTGFRQNVAYGETDDRYFFSIKAPSSCTFRARVKAKSQWGEVIYSNYVYINYLHPTEEQL